MLDVQVVVLDERKHLAGPGELLVEDDPIAGLEPVTQLGDEPVPLHGTRSMVTIDVVAPLQAANVVRDEPHRDVEAIGPDRVVGVESGAGRVLEPPNLGRLEVGEPAGCGDLGERGEHPFGPLPTDDAVDTVIDSSTCETPQLTVRAEQFQVCGGDRVGQAQIVDSREGRPAEAEVLEVGEVPQVEQGEVGLPEFDARLDQTVEHPDELV